MSYTDQFSIENGVLQFCSGSDGDIVVPEGVTTIGDGAFKWGSGMTSIVLPAGLTSIGAEAFQWCESLTSIVLPEGVTTIGEGAFQFCRSLRSVTIPESVTSIGLRAFYGCGNITFPGASEALLERIHENDFVITDGTLKKYHGSGGDVVIPQGVTRIDQSVFYRLESLTSIVIPEGVTSIGEWAFCACKNLANVVLPEGMTTISGGAFANCESLTSIVLPESVTTIGGRVFYECGNVTFPGASEALLERIHENDFIVNNGTLHKYNGSGGDVVIPEGVTGISDWGFSGCSTLASIVLPEGMTTIGEGAFASCKKLERIDIPESVTSIGAYSFEHCQNLQKFAPLSPSCKLGKNIFGSEFPQGLLGEIGEIYPCLTDGSLKNYVLCKETWGTLAPALKCEIFLKRQGKPLLAPYQACIGPEDAAQIGKAILDVLSGKPGTKDCTTAANFMTLCCGVAAPSLLQALYAKLKELKAAQKAIQTIENHPPLMEKLGGDVSVDETLPETEQVVARVLLERGQTVKDLEKKCKELYSLTFPDLPALRDAGGAELSPSVLAYLLTLHEKLEERSWGQPDVIAAHEAPGLCDEAKSLLSMLDGTSVQQALLALADKNLGLSGRSKKMFLAYPICRYADEALMTELTKRAPKWRSSVSGNDAPPLATFRKANAYSNTRAAMMFADKYHELDRYAKVHGTDEDTIRDQFLSDVGLDASGKKTYDLGNQSVVVCLQKDLSFLVELPTGKTAKSLPKKEADEEKYAVAKADFAEIKKSVKKISKNRSAVLFEDFLSGRSRDAESWQNTYLNNPILRAVAQLLVWDQNGQTFILAQGAPVTASGEPYAIGSDPITLAHPMEMQADNVTQWQKYFAAHGLKQPFEQIWEPVIDPNSITENRYAGCMIPYYRFTGQAKRGITVEDYDFHDEIVISIENCAAEIARIDWFRHEINPSDRFEIKKFGFNHFNRKTNHLVAYLDCVTVYDRIRNDDTTIAQVLPQFTLAQITEFINVASEHNCTNVNAVLLDYKNQHFADFDPMDEFTLDEL